MADFSVFVMHIWRDGRTKMQTNVRFIQISSLLYKTLLKLFLSLWS